MFVVDWTRPVTLATWQFLNPEVTLVIRAVTWSLTSKGNTAQYSAKYASWYPYETRRCALWKDKKIDIKIEVALICGTQKYLVAFSCSRVLSCNWYFYPVPELSKLAFPEKKKEIGSIYINIDKQAESSLFLLSSVSVEWHLHCTFANEFWQFLEWPACKGFDRLQ